MNLKNICEGNRKAEIVIVLGILLGAVLYVNFVVGYEPFRFIQDVDLPQLDISEWDDFTTFAVTVTILYDMLPTIAQQFSIGGITVQLLMTGFSPILFGIISAFGLLAGQMVLYVVGMFIKKIHKGGYGNIAGKHHFLHKYHFMIYLMIPFIGIVGDAGMLYSGHQRVNPIKMIPFLLIANFASTMRWILPTMAEIEVGNALR